MRSFRGGLVKIEIINLKKLTKIFVDEIKKKFAENFLLDVNWYWDVLENNKQEDQAPDLGIGSLFDDIKVFEEILSGQLEPCPLDLRKLGILFRAVGYCLTKSDKNEAATTELSIVDLNRISLLLLDRVELIEASEINFDATWYWNIALADQFVITGDKPIVTRKNIAVDMAALNQIMEDKRKPNAEGFDWFGQLLILLSEKIENGINIL